MTGSLVWGGCGGAVGLGCDVDAVGNVLLMLLVMMASP